MCIQTSFFFSSFSKLILTTNYLSLYHRRLVLGAVHQLDVLVDGDAAVELNPADGALVEPVSVVSAEVLI
jgi:hypothetical protein